MDIEEQLSIDVRGAAVIVAGELDGVTAPRLMEALESFTGRTVRVDMVGVTFIDSSGIRALLRAKSSGADLVIEPGEIVGRLLEMTGLMKHFGIS